MPPAQPHRRQNHGDGHDYGRIGGGAHGEGVVNTQTDGRRKEPYVVDESLDLGPHLLRRCPRKHLCRVAEESRRPEHGKVSNTQRDNGTCHELALGGGDGTAPATEHHEHRPQRNRHGFHHQRRGITDPHGVAASL